MNPNKITIRTGDPRLPNQAARQIKELFSPSNAPMKKRSKEVQVPIYTDWVMKSALKASEINAENEKTMGNLEVTSPKNEYKDFEDYNGNPMLAMIMLINHGNVGKAEYKRIDIMNMKRLYPALHKVLKSCLKKNRS